MVMLALLYLGGTYAQVSGAAFPLLGTGKKAYSDFRGVAKEPVRPTISPRRHMQLVKPITVSPIIAVEQPEFCNHEQFKVLLQSILHCVPVHYSSLCRDDRSPPIC